MTNVDDANYVKAESRFIKLFSYCKNLKSKQNKPLQYLHNCIIKKKRIYLYFESKEACKHCFSPRTMYHCTASREFSRSPRFPASFPRDTESCGRVNCDVTTRLKYEIHTRNIFIIKIQVFFYCRPVHVFVLK